MAQTTAQTDRDLASIAEARALARRAKEAAAPARRALPGTDRRHRRRHGRGRHAAGRGLRPAGRRGDRLRRRRRQDPEEPVRLREGLPLHPADEDGRRRRARIEDRSVIEIAEPFGVVAAIVPSTNPTSTAIYKILIALKARCPIVLSPHPSAVRCITRVAEVMDEAARRAGAPDGAINWMTTVTLEGTQELMKQREVAVILATGGMGLVRAAYSAGKPAYGVGPGNAPAYIERTADVAKAVRDIVTGKTFDNGVLCSSENSVVVDAADRRGGEAASSWRRAATSCRRPRSTPSARVLVTPQRLPNPALVGKSAHVHRRRSAASRSPPTTRVLIAPLDGVGRDYPAVDREALPGALLLRRRATGARAASAASRSCATAAWATRCPSTRRTTQVILEFGLKKPAFRIVVNSPTTHGSIGLTTGLDPAMTLGCGGYGGNITSDNISPRHLLNIKRLAYEVTPVSSTRPTAPAPEAPALPKAPAPPRRRRASPPDRSPGESTSFWRPGATSPRRPVQACRSRARTPPRPRRRRPSQRRAPLRACPAGFEAARVRLRGRCAAGVTAGSQARHRRTDHRDARRQGFRRAASPVRRRGMAEVKTLSIRGGFAARTALHALSRRRFVGRSGRVAHSLSPFALQ